MKEKRKFIMVEKGWEYRTDGYTIKKGYDRKAITHTGYSTLDRYGWIRKWKVYPDEKKVIYTFKTLKEAKQFISNKDREVLV